MKCIILYQKVRFQGYGKFEGEMEDTGNVGGLRNVSKCGIYGPKSEYLRKIWKISLWDM